MRSMRTCRAQIVKSACKEAQERVRAARNLGALADKCTATINQISGAVGSCRLDDTNTVTLGHINNELKSLGNLVVSADEQAAKAQGGCCWAFIQGGKARDWERELEATEKRLKEHLDMLVASESLATFARRPSAVIENPHGRRFWDTHFSDQREVDIDSFCEALNFEFKRSSAAKGSAGDLTAVQPALEVVRQVFGTKGPVTVLKFQEHFSTGAIEETLLSLSKTASAKMTTCEVVPIKLPSKEPHDQVQIGLVMVHEGATLRGVRHSIKSFIQESSSKDVCDSDSDMDSDNEDFSGPEYDFLRQGRFSFFLRGGETKVRRKQEALIADADLTSRVWLAKDVRLHVCLYVCVSYACVYVCMCVCVCVCIYECMYACMYVCMYVMSACYMLCMHACMHVCMYAGRLGSCPWCH